MARTNTNSGGEGGGSVFINGAEIANPNFINTPTLQFSVLGSNISANVLPQGISTSIQVNDTSALAGYSDFTYTNSTKTLLIGAMYYRYNSTTRNFLISDTITTFGASSTDNLFIGTNKASTGSSALRNLAIDRLALNALTTGDDNFAIGGSALASVSTGSRNMAMGQFANSAIVNVNNSIAIGHWAGRYTTGGDNVLVGSFTLGGSESNPANAQGQRNVIIGSAAATGGASGISTTNNSVIIGYVSCGLGGLGLGFNSVIVIGSESKASQANELSIGSISTNGQIFSSRIGMNTTDTNGMIYTQQNIGTNLSYGASSPRLRIGGSGLPTNASALAEFNSTTTGLLLPRMTTAQRDAIVSPVAGLIIYNTTTSAFNGYNGAWVAL